MNENVRANYCVISPTVQFMTRRNARKREKMENRSLSSLCGLVVALRYRRDDCVIVFILLYRTVFAHFIHDSLRVPSIYYESHLYPWRSTIS